MVDARNILIRYIHTESEKRVRGWGRKNVVLSCILTFYYYRITITTHLRRQQTNTPATQDFFANQSLYPPTSKEFRMISVQTKIKQSIVEGGNEG